MARLTPLSVHKDQIGLGDASYRPSELFAQVLDALGAGFVVFEGLFLCVSSRAKSARPSAEALKG